ncbi:uncharacterized protein zgc:113229 [Scomber scombrus]|uniref:Uncharacterized protein zgc:113229 n=1 Tax=Scomber scombrus TaxID=13677 RepID=A0AAV1PP66_SCOSC|nr:uncharacterized protein zgc:113229 [Scomber scombrus]
MSQSHNPKDNQAVLQSMLQRLKLQPGRETQATLNTSVPTTATSTLCKDGKSGASDFQKVNSSHINAFEFGVNGIPTKRFGISAADSNFGIKDRERQQPEQSSKLDSVLVSVPSHKDNTDGDTGVNRVLGQVTLPGINHAGTGQPFPAKSLKDADITSFERTDGEIQGETGSFGSIAGNKDAVTTTGQNQEQGFTPRVYVWSLKGADIDTGGQENKVLHVGNGEFGALAQSKDTQTVQASQKTSNSSPRRNQRTSENKTRRWTQRIKERWRERPGAFGKKGKEEGLPGIESSPQNQPLTSQHVINTSNEDGERIVSPRDSIDTSETISAHSEERTYDGHIRSSDDFEFGLGSFSLLEEITTGQEWAKFLKPTISASQWPSKEQQSQPKITHNPYNSGQSSMILNQQGGGNNQWDVRGSKLSPVSDFRMAQISPDAFLSASMGIVEGKHDAVQDVHSRADQLEPMDHGHTQLNMQSEERRQGRTPSFVQSADILLNPALKSRVHSNRKRQHRSAEMTEGSTSSLNVPSSHVMEETGESQHDNVFLNPPLLSLSPSSFTPYGPTPRGVLKHSVSQDSESSMETMTKRRRVEENRRVRFSEQVVTIAPQAELDMDVTDSEEDSVAEEDSIIEQEFEVEPVPVEEQVAPARRPALPAWILALKRKNMGKKH